MNKNSSPYERSLQRLFHVLEVGPEEDRIGRAYDIINLLSIVINLAASILYTFEEFRIPYGDILLNIERGTVAFFALDYVLRL